MRGGCASHGSWRVVRTVAFIFLVAAETLELAGIGQSLSHTLQFHNYDIISIRVSRNVSTRRNIGLVLMRQYI